MLKMESVEGFMKDYGIYLQALFIQAFYRERTDTPMRLDLEGLEYYSACWFGGFLAYRLFSGETVPDVNYPLEINLSNLDKIRPNGIYHFFLDTEIECHHFCLVYPENGTPKVFQTYGGVPIFSVITWNNPIDILSKLLNRNLKTYKSAFNIHITHLKPYKEISITVNIKPYYAPDIPDLFDILHEIRQKITDKEFIRSLKAEGVEHSLIEDVKELEEILELYD